VARTQDWRLGLLWLLERDYVDSPIIIANEADLAKVINQIPKPEPGETCAVCERPFPKQKSDDATGPRREVLSISIPKGEEGELEQMLIQLVDKYQEQWPRDYAAMRQSVGLEVVGGRSWKYYAVHFSVYACLNVPGLAPTEEG
jgi:hypothetical protein